jgi:hypothetical protein
MSSPPQTRRPAAFAGVNAPIVGRTLPIIGQGAVASAVGNVFQSYPYSTLASGAGFSYASTEEAERRAVAVRFARLARNIQGVREVRLAETTPDLEVAVVMREPDLDRELELRGLFIEVVCEELDPSVGELYVYPLDEAPRWVEEAALLT